MRISQQTQVNKTQLIT